MPLRGGWLVLAIVLLFAAMLALKYFTKWAVTDFGYWVAIPIFAVIFAAAFWFDRRDRQREG